MTHVFLKKSIIVDAILTRRHPEWIKTRTMIAVTDDGLTAFAVVDHHALDEWLRTDHSTGQDIFIIPALYESAHAYADAVTANSVTDDRWKEARAEQVSDRFLTALSTASHRAFDEAILHPSYTTPIYTFVWEEDMPLQRVSEMLHDIEQTVSITAISQRLHVRRRSKTYPLPHYRTSRVVRADGKTQPVVMIPFETVRDLVNESRLKARRYSPGGTS